MLDSNAIRELSYKILDDNKAQDIQEIDISGMTTVADTMIICTATSNRHANALADKLLRGLREQGVKPIGVEGEEQGDWILVDLLDVIVHIMLAEAREFYQLEKLWQMVEKTRQTSNEN